MATLAELSAFSTVLADLNIVATRDVVDVVRFVATLAPDEQRQFLELALGDVLGPHVARFEAVAAEFYLQDRPTASKPPRVPLWTPPEGRVSSLAGYGLEPLTRDEPSIEDALSRITGGSQELLYDVQRDTVIEMASQEPHEVRYQRMAQPGCCAFCAMLASRGAVYSESSVSRVVGRGVPLGERSGGRGRTGKGVKARGKRPIGEKYHNGCRCVGVAVHEGRAQQMAEVADKWYEVYTDARFSALDKFERDVEEWYVWGDKFTSNDGVTRQERHTEKRYSWIDDRKASKTYGEEVRYEQITKQVVADMRRIGSEKYGLVLK